MRWNHPRGSAASALCMALCMVLAATSAQAAPLSVPSTRFVLKNGMTVVLAEDHAVPRVFFSIRFNVGSSREEPGRTGFAHLFEHLMFEGSEHVPEGKFDQWLEAAGGDNNAYTSNDETYYFEEVPKSAAELPLFLDSDRMGFFAAKLAGDLVDGQRDVVKNERRQSHENRPWGTAELVLPGALWPKGHPYSWPVIGSMEDLTAASIDDVKKFYLKWYAPENAVMVVVGDFDSKQMRALVEKWFADVPARSGDTPHPERGAIKKDALPAVPMTGEKRVIVEDPIAPLPKLIVAWRSVPLWAPDDARLDMMSDILGADKASRLSKRLIHEMHIAQEVSVYQQSMDRAGELHIEIVAAPGVKLGDIQTVVDEELDKLLADGPTDAELARAKARVEANIANALDSLSQKAGRLSSYTAALGEPDSFEKDVQRYRAVDTAAVRDAARRTLTRGRVVMSVVPAGQLELAVKNPTRFRQGGAR